MRAAALLLALLFGTVPSHGERPASGGLVPLRGDGTSWMVHVVVNGRVRGLFLLDTGASYCVVAPTLARSLGLPPTGSFATVHTANGVVRAPVVRIASLVLGDTRAHDVQAIVHDAVGAPLDGVIGLNLLNRYRYAIDPQRRVLELD